MSEHITKHDYEETEESYFASFTDLLVGVIFIFIIMLMLFASNMRKQEQIAKEVTEQVTEMIKSRNIVLHEIERSLKEQGIEVTVDEQEGVLRLPDKILFDKGKYELSPEGNAAVVKLAQVLKIYLPCLAKVNDEHLKTSCKQLSLKSPESLEAVLIEGHTDHTGEEKGFDNWTLSVDRAVNVFQGLVKDEPVLDNSIYNNRSEPVLAVSGYSSKRPIIHQEEAAQNRRIDLRFIMRSPTPQDVERISHTISER